MSTERSSNALAVQVERRIFLVRGQKVMLDFDLAELLWSLDTCAKASGAEES